MNAQKRWKLAYRQYMFAASYRVRAHAHQAMRTIRREAALERRIASLEREIERMNNYIHAEEVVYDED